MTVLTKPSAAVQAAGIGILAAVATGGANPPLPIAPEQWQLLNDIHGGLLVYVAQRSKYFATRVSRWIEGAAVTWLLQQQLITQSGETPWIYRLSETGVRLWATMPDISADGQCDYCGRVRQVRPHRQDAGADVLFRFLCDLCGERVAEEQGIV